MRAMLPLISIFAFLQFGVATEQPGVSPASIAGLIAHYDADALHHRLRDGEAVARWEDRSGNGHHLTAETDNALPLFRVRRLGGMPVVEIAKDSRFSVEQPFELGDHTIVLVHAASFNQSALFSSESDDRRGLCLALGGRTHSYQLGKLGIDAHYNVPRELPLDYGITVLGRKQGLLKSFIDGIEYSSDTTMDEPLRVGRLFYLRQSTYVTRGGEGLKIAELMFYDRFLEKSERGSLTDHLADKYGIAVEQTTLPRRILPPGMQFEMNPSSAMAYLVSHSGAELNGGLVALEWQSEAAVASSLSFDAESAPSELHCERDATRVRLKVVVPIVSAQAGVELRGLFLRNGEEYHPEETRSSPFAPSDSGYSGELRLSTTMTLDAGEFVEFVVSRAAGEGSARIAPAGARLLIEPID